MFAHYQVGVYIKKQTTWHWEALKQVIRYFVSTVGHVITIQSGQVLPHQAKLLSYDSVTRFYGDALDSKSTTGIIITYNGTLVGWLSMNKDIIYLSTTEVSYIALVASVQTVHATQRVLE